VGEAGVYARERAILLIGALVLVFASYLVSLELEGRAGIYSKGESWRSGVSE
jgi:hypothetical protein